MDRRVVSRIRELVGISRRNRRVAAGARHRAPRGGIGVEITTGRRTVRDDPVDRGVGDRDRLLGRIVVSVLVIIDPAQQLDPVVGLPQQRATHRCDVQIARLGMDHPIRYPTQRHGIERRQVGRITVALLVIHADPCRQCLCHGQINGRLDVKVMVITALHLCVAVGVPQRGFHRIDEHRAAGGVRAHQRTLRPAQHLHAFDVPQWFIAGVRWHQQIVAIDWYALGGIRERESQTDATDVDARVQHLVGHC